MPVARRLMVKFSRRKLTAYYLVHPQPLGIRIPPSSERPLKKLPCLLLQPREIMPMQSHIRAVSKMALIALLVGAGSNLAHAGALIVNGAGTVALGVNDAGHLN